MDTLYDTHNMINTISEKPLGTGILAFRDIPNALKDLVTGVDALDFGCGTGRSSRFLKNLGFNVTGVDASEKMILEAITKDDGIAYKLISSIEKLSEVVEDKKYDLILVSFVTMEISTKMELIEIFQQLNNQLKNNGSIVVIAASDYLYRGDWLSMDTSFSENADSKSGDIVKIYLKDYDIEIKDYLWLERDLDEVFSYSQLTSVKKLLPLGKLRDNKNWLDELKKPPFVIYFLKEKN